MKLQRIKHSCGNLLTITKVMPMLLCMGILFSACVKPSPQPQDQSDDDAIEPASDPELIAGINLLSCQPFIPNESGDTDAIGNTAQYCSENVCDIACGYRDADGQKTQTSWDQLDISLKKKDGTSVEVSPESADERTDWHFIVQVSPSDYQELSMVEAKRMVGGAEFIDQAALSVPLVSALLAAEPNALDFGISPLRATKNAEIKVVYSGEVAARIVSIGALTDGFQYSGGSYPGSTEEKACRGDKISDEAASGCLLKVQFNPEVLKLYENSLTIEYSNGPRIEELTVDISGVGGLVANTVIGQDSLLAGNTLANKGGSLCSSETVNNPLGLEVEEQFLYLADNKNNRVVVYDLMDSTGSAIHSYGGDLNGACVGNVSLTASVVNLPFSVSVTGNMLYALSSFDRRVLVWDDVDNIVADRVVGQASFDSNAMELSQVGFNRPFDVISTADYFLISDKDNNRVLYFDKIPSGVEGTSSADRIAADAVIGQSDFTSGLANRGSNPTALSLNKPTGLLVVNGKLLIADTSNNRILLYDRLPMAGENSLSATVVIGQNEFNESTPNHFGLNTITAKGLNNPIGMDSDGKRLFVVDQVNNRVLIWLSIPTTNFQKADLVFGQEDCKTGTANQQMVGSTLQENQPLDRSLKNPTDLKIYNNTMYISDSGNNRIIGVPLPETWDQVSSGQCL
ncbi:MAG: hypothetical protein R3B45_15005 [Bdellovibrionota bacterium]